MGKGKEDRSLGPGLVKELLETPVVEVIGFEDDGKVDRVGERERGMGNQDLSALSLIILPLQFRAGLNPSTVLYNCLCNVFDPECLPEVCPWVCHWVSGIADASPVTGIGHY